MTRPEYSVGRLPYYRIDLEASLPKRSPSRRERPQAVKPKQVARFALTEWNAYLRSGLDTHRQRFLGHVSALMDAEVRAGHDLSLWPTPVYAEGSQDRGHGLSAGIQGTVASTLLRASLLLDDEIYLRAARRALRALETEILDGGVGSVVGADGLFFEEVAAYPAAHILSGFLLGVLGLYEYFALFGELSLSTIIDRSKSTLHSLTGLYDTGYWSRVDLLDKHLATAEQHRFHVNLLRAVVSYARCDHCASLADAWAGYERRRSCRVRRALAERTVASRDGLARVARRLAFPQDHSARSASTRDLVCVALPAFPVAGGTRAIVLSMADVMAQAWDVVYLTHQVGPYPAGFRIEQFGGRISNPWQFPNVWFHAWAGCRKLISLVRRGNRFRLILPQDGSYTAFFSAIVGQASGARVVSVEHGTVMFPYSDVYRAEQLASVDNGGIRSVISRVRLALFWPSLHLMARLATRITDQFLVAGDEIEETYREHLGVHPSRIVRFNPAIDTEMFAPLDPVARERERARVGISANALIIAMNGRLAPEKGLDIALRGLAQALADLPLDLQGRLRMLIAGDGPSRAEVQALLRTTGLESITELRGEAQPPEVASLLSISDIFLYTSLRGTNTSLAVLEAMAAGCTVLASEQPRAHAKLLADGRGISTPPGDLSAVTSALLRVTRDADLRAEMGRSARAYVVRHYSRMALKRAVMRATYYSPVIPPPIQS